MAREYKDWFTLDGSVKPIPGVNQKKVEAVKDLVERSLKGNREAAGRLVEAITTSDALFNLAHLVNVNFLPQFEEAPRTWDQIASVRTLSDFRPAVLYGIAENWGDGVLGNGDPRHVAPIVPEGTAYPYAALAGEESASAGLAKRGFKMGVTWEALINDTIGALRALPDEMLQVALDTEEYLVYNALVTYATAAQQLDGGTVPDGTTVPANAALARASLIQALFELKNREVNGRKVAFNGGFNLVVAVGQGDYANFVLNNISLSEIGQGTLTLSVNGYNPLAGITVIESEYVTGLNWYLLPKKGTTRRPALELFKMVGQESPELRVSNFTGTYAGGGAVSPFEGSFATDSIDFRLRHVVGSHNWSPDFVLWSTGAGGAPTPPA